MLLLFAYLCGPSGMPGIYSLRHYLSFYDRREHGVEWIFLDLYSHISRGVVGFH